MIGAVRHRALNWVRRRTVESTYEERVRAEHRETHASKLFSSLVTRDDIMGTRNSGINVTFVVLGDDASDYLGTGERFALWDGHDLGLGVITRRIFV